MTSFKKNAGCIACATDGRLSHINVRTLMPLERKAKPFNLKSFVKNVIRAASYTYPARQEAIQKVRIPAPADWPNKRVSYVAPCAICGKLHELSGLQVDHKSPVIPVTGWPAAPASEHYESLPGMVDMNVLVYRMFVTADKLQVICKRCHDEKTSAERKERVVHKSGPSSPEAVEKRAQALRGRPTILRGVPKSEEHKAAISAALKGKPLSSLKKVSHKQMTEANKCPVIAENLTTHEVIAFPSIVEASAALGIHKSCIGRAANGVRRRTRDYIFRFAEAA